MAAALLLAGCMVESPSDDLPPGEDGAGVGLSPFADDGPARGLGAALQPTEGIEGVTGWGTGGRLIARDIDGDDDIDLLFAEFTGPPAVYLNDGGGYFTRVDPGFSLPEDVVVLAATAADLTSDGTPDLLLGARSQLFLCVGLGGGRFDEPSLLFALPEPTKVELTSVAVGDVDGDGASDLLLSTSGYQIDGDGEPFPDSGAPDWLLLRRVDGWLALPLEGPFPGSSALVATLSDVDNDGDLDVYVPQDEARPGLLWRASTSGGQPAFDQVAADVGVDIPMSAMGFDSADLNDDGRLDYCVSDIGNPVCLLSEGDQSFVNGTAALGLDDPSVGWGLALGDLDNDGHLELVQASGPADDEDSGDAATSPQPNRLWRGLPSGGFAPAGAALGFGSTDNDLGVATVDLDGDGSLDVVLAGPGRAPKLWMNPAGPGAWIEVRLEGPPGAPEGFGAQVAAIHSERIWLREVTSGRGPNQGSTIVHLGLGSVEALEQLEVRWPDGRVSTLDDVATRQRVVVTHPSWSD